MPFFPLLLVLAGLTLFLSRRRYKAIEAASGGSPRSPHVVVKGHTYSDSVEGIELRPLPSTKIENVHSACIIGAGHVGALTAIILASQNPHVQFCVVDRDASLIEAWKSDRPPILEPGLEDLLFDDPPGFAMEASSLPEEAKVNDSSQNNDAERTRRQRKLANLAFSTNIHAGVVSADLVFLCVECSPDTPSETKEGINLAPLEAAIQAIAQVSTGHKIIVQRSTAPCGIVQRIKKALRKTASPTATFDVLSNPDFLIPGTAIRDLLYPPRVLIGHIFSEDMSVEAITALKRLYLPWVPEERLITMDAWSAELCKLAANACLAQQISNVQSLSAICESTNANIAHITQTLGLPPRVGLGFGGGTDSLTEILCLIYLARELGLHPVAEYWRAVLQMNEFYHSRTAKRVTERFTGELKDHRVAILGFAGVKTCAIRDQSSTAVGLARDLMSIGVQVTVFDPRIPGDQLRSALRLADASLEAVTIVDSVDAACQGCSGLILLMEYDEFSHEQVRWQGIAGQMQGPKVFLDLCGVLDRFKMQQWGFDMLQLGVRQKDAH
ncbi:putative UDP-glucose dehydrogenase Ugd1 [Aspergillus brunneoviolaceus CBS 621.78]|uniref:UDP-glucose dehydrogenase Ugd1 n=1 Tax=Aspergillus brunneoviolaceus CBS 621.78 TaxID=1450534 RepID=A0ACD1GP58_9EURO|nr:UDP-glucose dehydrogenase Ugd1 [Aspergillus brunneoviolaceus CBS 621.78]RAH50917.1 UDP-glucose dehydrogenase Ugd1 [Aspergillus brunneoviolaceus CBS 621.78]